LKRKRIGDMVERILRDVILELSNWESGFLETLIPDTYDLAEYLPNPVRVIRCQQVALYTAGILILGMFLNEAKD
jgi:hypothetical protein